jgi:hypothetical protein
MRIEILDEALDDLAQGFRFYEEQQAGIGTYFVDSLYSDIDSLRLFAGIHRVVFGFHRCLSKRFPFAIYYTTTCVRMWLASTPSLIADETPPGSADV